MSSSLEVGAGRSVKKPPVADAVEREREVIPRARDVDGAESATCEVQDPVVRPAVIVVGPSLTGLAVFDLAVGARGHLPPGDPLANLKRRIAVRVQEARRPKRRALGGLHAEGSEVVGKSEDVGLESGEGREGLVEGAFHSAEAFELGFGQKPDLGPPPVPAGRRAVPGHGRLMWVSGHESRGSRAGQGRHER